MKKIICEYETELGILNAQLELSLESEKVKKTKLCEEYNITDLVINLRQMTDCACESKFRIYSVTKEDLQMVSDIFKNLAKNYPE